MKAKILIFEITSPSGKTFSVSAETLYHACQIAAGMENFIYSNAEYLKLNSGSEDHHDE